MLNFTIPWNFIIFSIKNAWSKKINEWNRWISGNYDRKDIRQLKLNEDNQRIIYQGIIRKVREVVKGRIREIITLKFK